MFLLTRVLCFPRMGSVNSLTSFQINETPFSIVNNSNPPFSISNNFFSGVFCSFQQLRFRRERESFGSWRESRSTSARMSAPSGAPRATKRVSIGVVDDKFVEMRSKTGMQAAKQSGAAAMQKEVSLSQARNKALARLGASDDDDNFGFNQNRQKKSSPSNLTTPRSRGSTG